MPVIDSSSDSKFDALIRTNKADALMSFIMATSTVKEDKDRKINVARKLKSAYELYRENIKGSDSGAGTYGDGSREILEQFESHYTMGYEMGIWIDSDLNLSQLAQKVSSYKITVAEYIGTVFINLFSYYKKGNKDAYHHFLLEILNKIETNNVSEAIVTKEMISETLPIEKANEQANIIFNYLIASDIFDQIDKNSMRFSDKWDKNLELIKSLCNLEYVDLPRDEANEIFKDKQFYSDYVTKPAISEDTDSAKEDEISRLEGGINVLLYGVPGSGKSWTIQNEYCNDESIIERLVFHNDYTYSDFVGQILPNTSEEGLVSYPFTPGPFTRLLKKAYTNPQKSYYLIIEEINRGNAPAIFGDIFQLLDRKKTRNGMDDEYAIGTSEYGITNYDIARTVYNDPDMKVRIPSNMSIIATMNTSDQNVFTLDNAFQRRWDMRMIDNAFNSNDNILANMKILDTDITWRVFVESINNIILDNNLHMTSSEDKRLGKYFISLSDLKYEGNAKINKFPEKVIKYLWDDAFKFSREEIFDTINYNSLEKVIRRFNEAKGNLRFTIFNENILNTLTLNPSVEELINQESQFNEVNNEE